MLTQLRTMDVGFLTSVARLVTGCSVLDWNAYERYQKSEMMQSSTSLGWFVLTVFLYVHAYTCMYRFVVYVPSILLQQ